MSTKGAILYPYQQLARDAVYSEWDKGLKKTLIVLPTGSGKTIVFSSIVKTQIEKGHRVLVIAHRDELLKQASKKLKCFFDIDSAIEKGPLTCLRSDASVAIGSVQTISKWDRLNAFPKDYFQDIIIDEAHHSVSKTYMRVLEYFEEANVLGVTATPDRGDMKNLGTLFDSKAYEYSLAEGINDGYLSPIKAQMIPLKIDLSKLKENSDGDFENNEVGSALDPYLYQIAEEMKKHCEGRKTVVFLPLIRTSQKFCRILNDIGFHAAEVDYKVHNREEILQNFEDGRYNVVCNPMLLTEGWDCPSVDCVVVLRPTRIRSLYQQMVGRGIRNCEGKKDLLLLDFLWMTAKHDLCRPSVLISKEDAVAQQINRIISSSVDGVDLTSANKEATRRVIIEREENLAWHLRTVRRSKEILIDPIQYAASVGAKSLIDYTPIFAWETTPPSEEQIKFLQDQGIKTDNIKSLGEARMLVRSVILGDIKKLSTPKQIKMLERFGFQNVGLWSAKDTGIIIGKLRENNWEVPDDIDPETYQPGT